MSEAKHTAGPWRDKPGSGYGKEFRIFSDKGDVLKGDQLEPGGISLIGRCPSGGRCYAQRKKSLHSILDGQGGPLPL